jgi:catechol 2,3-dioxygenase-like lactoylglutathione lyase family enzyme
VHVLLAVACSMACAVGIMATAHSAPQQAAPVKAAPQDSGTPLVADAQGLDLTSALDAGWQEAVISTRDAGPLLTFFTRVAGWRVRAERPLDAATRRFYLPDESSPSTAGRQWLISDAEGRPGFVRLIEFGVPQAMPIRGSTMAWDTGGILSLMTRSNATPSVYRAALDLGWSALNDPVELNLPDTGVKLTNVILRGPEGVQVSVYERISPRMADASDLQRLRRPFNSMQVVRDLARAKRFYVEALGFEPLNEGVFTNPVREPNNFGVPGNLVPANPLPFAILGPKKTGPTQIELIQFAGVEGRDVSASALPPNRGVVALRFPVSSLETLQQRLQSASWPLTRPATRLTLDGFGPVRLLAVRSPDGVWLEFFERTTP